MLFAKIPLAAAVVFALSSGIAGMPSVRSDTVAGSPSSARLIPPPQTFYSGPGYAKWANGSSVDLGVLPTPPATNASLQKRQTEIDCYNVGTQVADELANDLLTQWCETVVGTGAGWFNYLREAPHSCLLNGKLIITRHDSILVTDNPSSSLSLRIQGGQSYCSSHLILTLVLTSSCAFTIDPLNGCTFDFQQPLNDCNTATGLKQGGVYTIPCSQWRIDPGTFF
ncbi:hypothetical protein MVEN_02601000 [Mycena venus]|uniref:Uncharacterized protein n=1 Tax=Mycena venus TaxID=2733690 RepID=A0A8H6TZK4_9AGAR|nr:hypothetical protein MVEN_02601000 [Mycena venus]